jgi:hypothetical protein
VVRGPCASCFEKTTNKHFCDSSHGQTLTEYRNVQMYIATGRLDVATPMMQAANKYVTTRKAMTH